MSSFEDLEVWKRSKELAILVVKALAESKNFALRDQMTRSAISIPSNTWGVKYVVCLHP
jgi:hypothetical protein